ncbi:MAG TPA: hypothetical protein VMQ81_09630 [Acidimicrobiia bacterium]|nr:hypothetical protein [Acidimicrobiia bacterium]
MSFYDDVLLELLAALGAALFIGNLVALVRRRRDRETAPAGREQRDADLPAAPVARTLLYMALGFVVMVWGIASLIVA